MYLLWSPFCGLGSKLIIYLDIFVTYSITVPESEEIAMTILRGERVATIQHRASSVNANDRCTFACVAFHASHVNVSTGFPSHSRPGVGN